MACGKYHDTGSCACVRADSGADFDFDELTASSSGNSNKYLINKHNNGNRECDYHRNDNCDNHHRVLADIIRYACCVPRLRGAVCYS